MRSGDEKQTFKDVARELATAQSFISSPFIYLFDDKQVSSVTQSYRSIGLSRDVGHFLTLSLSYFKLCTMCSPNSVEV